jgi:hypothetical protein
MAPNQQTHHPSDNSIHFTLQGKGGVGKSFIAAILVQFLRARGRKVHPIDTDLVNHTLAQYANLGARRLELMRDGTIDTRVFDTLMEQLLTQNDADFVIDNGASTFVPLWHYLIDNNVLALLKSQNRKVFIHTVLTGGQALQDTMTGFKTLADTTDEQGLVLWLNEFFGPIQDAQKRHFLESPLYAQTKHKLLGVISIPRRNPDTFGRDIQEMLAAKLTFQEACENGHFSIMAKQRLKQIQANLFTQLQEIQLA